MDVQTINYNKDEYIETVSIVFKNLVTISIQT